jgi:putative Holliday junction resolvase
VAFPISNKYLGLDYGKVRIGIAVSDETGTIAFGREFIPNTKLALKYIKSLILGENISTVVIGLPVNLKGEQGVQAEEVNDFERRLRNFLNTESVKIIKWDERFTSKMAAESLIASGMKKKKRREKGNIDVVSAALLLQSYLDSIRK